MFEQKAAIRIRNVFRVVARNAVTEEIEEEFKGENIVLDRMYTRLLNFQPYFVNIVFGSGTGTPSVDRTTLFTRVGSKPAVEEELIRSFPVSKWTKSIRLEANEFNGNRITEVAISETTTNINTHALITDAEGNPLDIEKTASRIVDIYATVFIEIYDVDTGLFWYDVGLRNYLTGTGSAGNALGISLLGLDDVVTNPGTIVVNLAEKSVKSSVKFTVYDLNREIRYVDWVGIGLRCEIPRFGVFEGKQRNAVEIGIADGVKTIFKLPQNNITNLEAFVDGILNEDWTFTQTRAIKFNAPPVAGTVTANFYCLFYPKDANHEFHASMKIQFGIGQPSPVVPVPTMPILPGSQTAVVGDAEYGFFGEVPVVDLISGEDLCNQIGLTAGVLQNSDAGWLKTRLSGKHLFVFKKSTMHSVSWNSINEAGAVFGDSVVTIGTHVYLVRLITTIEWDKLIQPLHKDGINPRWGTYDNTDLNITGNGGYTWTSTPSGTRRVLRGFTSVGASSLDSPTNANSSNGFRPVLEFLYTLPSS